MAISVLFFAFTIGLVGIQVHNANGQSDPDLVKDGCTLATNDFIARGQVLVRRDMKLQLVVPRFWTKGKYNCVWGVNSVAPSGTRTIIGFSTDRANSFFNQRSACIGEVTIESSGIEINKFQFCSGTSFPISSKFISPGPATIRLTMDTREDNFDSYKFYFELSLEKSGSKLPKVVSVRDLSSRKSRFVKDYHFSWDDARKVCRRKYRGWDLCSQNNDNICKYDNWMFHYPFDQKLRYFPLLGYNSWMVINQTSSNCSNYSGPPTWGMDKFQCPEGGCEMKSQILCCPIDTTTKPTKAELKDVYITSALDTSGHVLYRYSWKPDNDDFFSDNFRSDPKPRWGNFWQMSGRMEGDVSRIQLYSTYSPKSETPIFFCSRKVDLNGKDDDVDNFRYMLSIDKCRKPWNYYGSAYGSRKFKKGLRPIYFGQSPSGHGTRISTTMPCCGYHNASDSFMIYGYIDKTWRPKLSSRFCIGQQWLAGEYPGTISSENNLQRGYSTPLYCHWRITVKRDSGIKINYETRDISGYQDCRKNYLEFYNPDSQRTLGRVCGTRRGSFWSDARVIEVRLVLENNIGTFSVQYEQSQERLPVPIEYEMNMGQESWANARQLCAKKGLQLCTKSDICPVGYYPYHGITNKTDWIPVGDKMNAWMKTKGTEWSVQSCEIRTESGPPSQWSSHWYLNPKPEHDTTFCCDREPHSVRVNVGYNPKYGDFYWFGKGEEWESPDYQFDYNDPWRSFPNGDFVHPWRPPSTYGNASTLAVDYFFMSSTYKQGYYDQRVYFCAVDPPDNLMVPWWKNYKMSLVQCKSNDGSFHLYAGRQMSTKTPFALHVGKMGMGRGKVCCERNPESFTVYVIEGGKVENYVHPGGPQQPQFNNRNNNRGRGDNNNNNDFRGGGNNDFRGGSNDYRGGGNDNRGGNNDFRGGNNDYRGRNNEYPDNFYYY